MHTIYGKEIFTLETRVNFGGVPPMTTFKCEQSGIRAFPKMLLFRCEDFFV